jgi:hypothetical protein
MPLSPPSTVSSPMGNMYISSGSAKQHLPNLVPLPLSPPILKPSTKPPHSLNAPNPTTRNNFSPTTPSHGFPSSYPIAGYSHAESSTAKRLVSHGASASMNMANLPSQRQPSRVKQRSPSQPHLPSYFSEASSQPSSSISQPSIPQQSPSIPQQPPSIPLRMSSIPPDSKPRKLALQTQRSLSALKIRNSSEEKDSAQAYGSTTPRRVSPPMRTNKALPSPPMSMAEEIKTREKVIGSTSPSLTQECPPKPRDSSPRQTDEYHKRAGQVWPDNSDQVMSPIGIAELQDTSSSSSTTRTAPHKRSASNVSATLHQPFAFEYHALSSNPTTTATPPPQTRALEQDIQPTPPLKVASSPKITSFPNPPTHASKPNPSKSTSTTKNPNTSSNLATEDGGWAAGTTSEGRPNQQSRTQRDRERKKKCKAKVLMEHVDVIRDEFWEKRPWILSGKVIFP